MKCTGIVFCAALTGCAWQSDAVKVGNNTYIVSVNASPARGGVTGATEMALRNARAALYWVGELFSSSPAAQEPSGEAYGSYLKLT